MTGQTDLFLIRHAPALTENRLAGRRDVGCVLPETGLLMQAATRLPAPERLLVSPLRRCRETAAALFPGIAPEIDPRLMEQDFGEWEGVPYADLPDLGPLSGTGLAVHCPPGGESFLDQCARTQPALPRTGGNVVVVAHAGTIRAALALVVGAGPALGFAVDPLSLTRMTALPNGQWVVGQVNLPLVPRFP